MATNPNPSLLDQQQILQRVMEESEDRLRVDAQVTATLGEVVIVMDAANDSVAIGDGTKEATITTVGLNNGLDVNVIQSALPAGAATSANQTTEIASLQILDDIAHTEGTGVSRGVPILGVLDDVSINIAVENTVSSVRITPYRALHTNLRDASGTAFGTATNPFLTSIADSANLDAFQRLRVSEPDLVFESIQKYDKVSALWDESLTGSATSTHRPNYSSTEMVCITASGDKAIRQTKQYFPYSPGRSQLVMLTGNFGGSKTNVRQRIGLFDVQNGIFFELSAGTMKAVRRTYTSGTAVDNTVAQSSWNIDKMDGTGTSGITLNFGMMQTIIIDLAWLGAGRVRVGWIVDGKIIYCHQFTHANSFTLPYMTTAKLPCRYEIENTGTAASLTTMLHTSSVVLSEGGHPTEGIIRSINTGTARTSTTNNVRRPILSIRLKSANIQAGLQLLNFSLITAGAQDVLYELILNPVLTGASFASAEGFAEYDVSATSLSITSGTTIVLDSGFLRNGANLLQTVPRNTRVDISTNLAGTSDILCLAGTSLGAGSTMSASLTYREIT